MWDSCRFSFDTKDTCRCALTGYKFVVCSKSFPTTVGSNTTIFWNVNLVGGVTVRDGSLEVGSKVVGNLYSPIELTSTGAPMAGTRDLFRLRSV